MENENQIELSAEQAADLAALEAAASEQAQDIANQAVAMAYDNREQISTELSGLVLALVQIAKPIFPSLEGIDTPETTQAAAGAVAALCVKHGWLQDGITGGHSEEIAAAMILLPLGFATYRGIQGDIAAARKKTQPDETMAQGDPGAKTVIVGAPVAAEGGDAD